MPIRVFSYGGGVQSNAALVLAAKKVIEFPIFVFANVGDDSENPDTLDYIRTIAKPYAEKNNIEFVEVSYIRRTGEKETLLEHIRRRDRSIPIPIWFSSGGPATRACTWTFKIRVVAKEMRRRGATKSSPGVVGLGISLDEYTRMRSDSPFSYYTIEYPLIELGIDREKAKHIIQEEGLPVPPKSSCWFCPYRKLDEWVEMKKNNPSLFNKGVELEQLLNEKGKNLGVSPVYLTSKRKKLQELQDESPEEVSADEGSCDSAGYCMV